MKTFLVKDRNLFENGYPEIKNPYFNWKRTDTVTSSDIVLFSDAFITDAHNYACKTKIGWLLEPPAINSGIYSYVSKNYSDFNFILTFADWLLKIDSRFVPYVYGTTWIWKRYRKVYEKIKLISAIFSGASGTEGHHLRHDIISKYAGKFDLYGRAYVPIIQKVQGLQDYMYSFAVENSNLDTYFTEKVIDCFLTGTVPIYWGTKRILDFFNPKGIIYFKSLEDLDSIMKTVSYDDYHDRLSAIKENYERAYDFLWFEKSMWENLLCKL